MDWLTFLASIATSSVLISIASAILLKYYEQHVEAKFTKELESIKAVHQKALDENRIRFSRFNEDRASRICQLYSRIAQLEKAIHEYVYGTGSLQDFAKFRKLVAIHERATNYYVRNEIYFDVATARNINQLLSAAGYVFEGFADLSEEEKVEVMKRLGNISTIEYPKLRMRLTKKFRAILSGLDAVSVVQGR